MYQRVLIDVLIGRWIVKICGADLNATKNVWHKTKDESHILQMYRAKFKIKNKEFVILLKRNITIGSNQL